MAKLGKNADLFVSGIHMIPDEKAFEKVQLIPSSALPPEFLPRIIKNISAWGKK
jgi:hypothetical protein